LGVSGTILSKRWPAARCSVPSAESRSEGTRKVWVGWRVRCMAHKHSRYWWEGCHEVITGVAQICEVVCCVMAEMHLISRLCITRSRIQRLMYLLRRLCARIAVLVVKHRGASVRSGFCRSVCSELAGLDSSSRPWQAVLASGTESSAGSGLS
jgi:hypothetical protein